MAPVSAQSAESQGRKNHSKSQKETDETDAMISSCSFEWT